VEAENRNHHRSVAHKLTVLKTIEVDAELERRVAEYGYRLDSVPPAGEKIFLRFGGNLSRGAVAVDETDRVHPRNAAMLIRAAKLVGLDISGIDYLTTDIGEPFDSTGGAICEVNSRVATRAHMAAELGTGKSVVGRLLDAIYQDSNRGRVPLVIVVGTTDRLAHDIAEGIASETGSSIAVVTSAGVSVNGDPMPINPSTSWEAHQILTEEPSVEFIVMSVRPDRILTEGLGVSHCDLIVIDQDSKAPADRNEWGVVLTRTGGVILESADSAAALSKLRELGRLA
jgi:cyanophycin synthetase